jgi:peptidoglycan/LPS O-acetylase OafA/YrhL
VREETKRSLEPLLVGLVAGVLHLAFISHRFATEQGRGGVTLLLGCTFITLVLWAMLALRSLAADKPFEPELDDGLVSGAVTAWLMAVVPPRASNFLPENATDDFARVYVPVSLVVVFVVLGAQALWPQREVKWVLVRLFASLAVSFPVLGALLYFASGGEDAGELAVRCLVASVVSALISLALRARAGRGSG